MLVTGGGDAASAGELTAPRVAGLVLAAGSGSRYGRPKALVEDHGRLLVDRAAQVLRDGGVEPVVVVLGAAAVEVRRRARLAGCTVVDNPAWPTGMGSSLRAGLAALAGGPAVAAVVLLVDQPRISAEAVRRVADRAAPDALVMAGYGEHGRRRGHPVLLGREHWPGVARAAVGEVGARPYLRDRQAAVEVVWCGDVADDRDVDVPGDWVSG